MIARHFGFVHLSAGELMRVERDSGSALGQRIKGVDEKGELLTGDIVLQVLDRVMEEHMTKGSHQFLLDGFPRSENNVTELRKWKDGECPPLFALFLECPDEVMKTRLLGRGTAGSSRWDDMDVAVIEKRIANYHSQTEPVIRFYGSAEGGNVFERINSDQGDPFCLFLHKNGKTHKACRLC